MADENETYQFDKESVQRIDKAVNYVERQMRGLVNTERAGQYMPVEGWWAKITDTDDNGKYSWTKQDPKLAGMADGKDDGVFWLQGNYGDETGFAIEAQFKSKYVLMGAIVWMQPSVLYDHFVFTYNWDIQTWQLPSTVSGGASFNINVSGHSIPLRNPYTGTIQANTTVVAGYQAGNWIIIGADCPSS